MAALFDVPNVDYKLPTLQINIDIINFNQDINIKDY